jgi:hypothetical protein
MDFEFDEDDDFSSALGTETLAARDMYLRASTIPHELLHRLNSLFRVEDT